MIEDQLTVRDKLDRYLSERKTPVTMQMMSERFMVDPKTIRTALADITGIVIVMIGKKHFYRKR